MKNETLRLIPLVAKNALEEMLVKGKAGQISPEECVTAVLHSTVYVPSRSEVNPDGSGFTPVLLGKEDGIIFVAAFSDLERAKEVGDRAKFCLSLDGSDLIKMIPIGYGLLINTGFAVRLDLLPVGVDHLRRLV